jgi:hypothetical protein
MMFLTLSMAKAEWNLGCVAGGDCLDVDKYQRFLWENGVRTMGKERRGGGKD